VKPGERSERVDDQLRRQLAKILCSLLERDALEDIEEFLGVHRSRISRLRGGKLSEFSIAWLLRAISRMGYDFTLDVAPRARATVIPARPTASVVLRDQFGRTVPARRG
jgi:predicted XRE-type DNA-binding protein